MEGLLKVKKSLNERERKKLTLEKQTVSNLDRGEMAVVVGGSEGSIVFTLCLCLTRFCSNTCP